MPWLPMNAPLTPDDLERAFALADFDPLPAQRAMEPAFRGNPPFEADTREPRSASALAYAFLRDGRLVVPLTLRREDLKEHKGQVSLPGGRPEPGETSFETAVREAFEEIGLARGMPTEIGRLHPVYIPVTHTRMTVHVAIGPDPGALRAEPREVQEVRLMAVDDLLAPERRTVEPWTILDREVDVPSFTLAGWTVWGATAIALGELAARLERVY